MAAFWYAALCPNEDAQNTATAFVFAVVVVASVSESKVIVQVCFPVCVEVTKKRGPATTHSSFLGGLWGGLPVPPSLANVIVTTSRTRELKISSL